MGDQQMFKRETDFIAWLRRRTLRRVGGPILGIGDDAALVRIPAGRELILTTDFSIEGVHFIRALHPPQSVGHRALARSLSDIAAMGGTPRYALISLGISRQTHRAWLDGFFDGLLALARRFGVAIIGGDTAVVDGPLTLDVIVAGEVPQGRALRRSGARRGDLIYVSGRLGMSALGWQLLQARGRRSSAQAKTALRAHLYPIPQCTLGRYLSEKRLASALIDLSDGLSVDLPRLCDASGVGARLFADQIPIPHLPDAEDGLELALHGGEDYQLLFTAPPAKAARIPPHSGRVPLSCIGEVSGRKGVDLIKPDGSALPLPTGGYDHFARISHL